MEPHTRVRDTRDARYDSLFLGEVVERNDPEGLGRIKVKVPGLLEPESRWALPVGAMYGVGNGIFAVPEVGSNVVVFLNQGHVNHPYYLPGPFGKPDGDSDVPQTAPQGDVDIFTIHWKGLAMTFDGRQGSEKIRIEDVSTTTSVEIDRASGGYKRDVEGPETVEVLGDRNVVVETGSETHTVQAGSQDTVVAQNRSVTTGGNEQKNVAGSLTEAVTGAASETVGTSKDLTAGLAVTITAGAAINLVAGGGVNISGAGLNVNSAGVANRFMTGLVTDTFLGGIIRSVTGVATEVFNGLLTQTFNGAVTQTYVGALTMLGQAILIGLGLEPSVSPGHRLLVTEEFIDWFLTHTHPVTTAPGATGPVVGQAVTGTSAAIPDPAIAAPDVDRRLIRTGHVRAS